MRTRSSAYVLLALGMAAVTFGGFWFTYFSRILGGDYPEVSPAVHLHGWSFFAWYLLLPLQALLMRASRVSLHRRLGLASIVLAFVMTLTGLVVLTVSIRKGLAADGFDFFKVFGLPVFTSLLLFAVFYSFAIANRKRAELHKRLIIIASAAGLGAAAFRLLGGFWDPQPWTVVAGITGTNVFIVAAMVHDKLTRGRIHRIYWIGLTVCAGIEFAAFPLSGTALGKALLAGLASLANVLDVFY